MKAKNQKPKKQTFHQRTLRFYIMDRKTPPVLKPGVIYGLGTGVLISTSLPLFILICLYLRLHIQFDLHLIRLPFLSAVIIIYVLWLLSLYRGLSEWDGIGWDGIGWDGMRKQIARFGYWIPCLSIFLVYDTPFFGFLNLFFLRVGKRIGI